MCYIFYVLESVMSSCWSLVCLVVVVQVAVMFLYLFSEKK